jgi:hypothetical protein
VRLHLGDAAAVILVEGAKRRVVRSDQIDRTGAGKVLLYLVGLVSRRVRQLLVGGAVLGALVPHAEGDAACKQDNAGYESYEGGRTHESSFDNEQVAHVPTKGEMIRR